MRRLMTKRLSIGALLVTSALLCPAQNSQKTAAGKSRPDLSGTWLLSRDKDDTSKSAPRAEVKLRIVQSESEIKMHRVINHGGQPTTLDFTYFTDGRGETNQTTMYLTTNPGGARPPGEPDVTRSKTRWSGEKLVTRALIRSLLSGHMLEYEVVDEWKLSADGKRLTQTTRWIYQPDPLRKSIYFPSGASDTKRVYVRVDD